MSSSYLNSIGVYPIQSLEEWVKAAQEVSPLSEKPKRFRARKSRILLRESFQSLEV